MKEQLVDMRRSITHTRPRPSDEAPAARTKTIPADLQQIIEACAAATKAKGFDLSQHATTIGLIATEVTEALHCLHPIDTKNTTRNIVTYVQTLQLVTNNLEKYRANGDGHFDVTTIADQEHLLEELADICIRVFSYVGANGWRDDFIAAMLKKIQEGATRPQLHNKAF